MVLTLPCFILIIIMEEIYKDIIGYEGEYYISNKGNVKSKKAKVDIILKPRISNCGYLRIALNKNKSKKQYSIHRLVAKAFIPNSENKSQVNHIDGVKTNNFVENLEWVTPSENTTHSYKFLNKKPNLTGTGKFGKLNGHSYSVIQYDLLGNKIKVWECMTEAQNTLKISRSCISNCCRNKQQTAGKFKWKYLK